MNKFKKSLIIIAIAIAFIAPVVAGDSADVTITTFVGENLQNSGIRIIEGNEEIDNVQYFDSRFFPAQSVITLGNTTLDSSLYDVSGAFTVLVRRANESDIKVYIKANPLTNGNSFITYTLESSSNLDGSEGNLLTINGTANNGRYYIAKPTMGVYNSLRHVNQFDYNIPADNSAPMGNYSATITFTLETN